MNTKAFSRRIEEHFMGKPPRDRLLGLHGVGDQPAKPGKPPSVLRKRRK